MQNTGLSTGEYKKISKSWQEAFSNSSLTNYTGKKAEYSKWYEKGTDK